MYTIVVNLGPKEVPKDAEKIDIDNIAFDADIQPTNDADNSDGNYEDINKEDYVDKGERNHQPKDFGRGPKEISTHGYPSVCERSQLFS